MTAREQRAAELRVMADSVEQAAQQIRIYAQAVEDGDIG